MIPRSKLGAIAVSLGIELMPEASFAVSRPKTSTDEPNGWR